MLSDLNFFFFFNDTATTEIYTLSLHDALPISPGKRSGKALGLAVFDGNTAVAMVGAGRGARVVPQFQAEQQSGAVVCVYSVERSEEHTSELQSRQYLVCRLLLEKKTTGHR